MRSLVQSHSATAVVTAMSSPLSVDRIAAISVVSRT
jgi:hypothetical protein